LATFGTWLTEQVHRTDEVGQLARAWRDAEGNRPKVHSPSGIQKWLEATTDYKLTRPWLDVTLAEYRDGRAPLSAAQDTPLPGWLLRIEAKLDTVMTALGLTLPEEPAMTAAEETRLATAMEQTRAEVPAFMDPLATREQAHAAIEEHAATQDALNAAQKALLAQPVHMLGMQPDSWASMAAMTDWSEAAGDE
jgi:hypothetical protein